MSCCSPADARQEPRGSSSRCGAQPPACCFGSGCPASCLPAHRAIWPAALSKHRLLALECLNALCACGKLPARLFPPERRGPRLNFVLRALDGALAGESHREIAEALVGQARVRSDWNDPQDHLRDRIRRAVSRGRALMNGEYLNLLL
ncbi:DUF2285 domain-containing protein [Mesorhizobium sp. M1121]|uniref:DUF2285 domain-containing protein n=1 Tax=Mesorhizobium sp. M1121 TaxID=2957058 RepID=UPI003337CE37